MAHREGDPYGNFNFIVEIDGIEVAGFSDVSGISSETEVIEYRTGDARVNTVRKLPGLHKIGDITLKRGITGSDVLWQWRKSVTDGNLDRRSASIILLDEARQEVLRWNLSEAWPSKYVGSDLHAKGHDVAIETLVITCESINLG